VKSLTPNAGHAFGYGYAGKAVATPKSHRLNAGHAVGYGDAGKVSAIVKSPIPNAGHAFGYGYAGKVSAIVKSPILNAGQRAAGKVKADVFAWCGNGFFNACYIGNVQSKGIRGIGAVVGEGG